MRHESSGFFHPLVLSPMTPRLRARPHCFFLTFVLLLAKLSLDAGYIETRLEQALELCAIDDPLLRFSEGLLRGVPYPFGETVNLLPLFACAGALCDLELRDVERNALGKKHIHDALIETATSQGWHLFLPDEAFRTAIVVARGPIPVMAQKAVNLRKQFAEQGVYLSSYSKGRIRLALPPRMLSQSELATFSQAMRSVANSKTTGNFRGTAESSFWAESDVVINP